VLGETAAQWVALGWAGSLTPRRVRQDRWSPLEYACHVRDVFALLDYRAATVLTLDDPLLEDWDQDAAAHTYAEGDPTVVVSGIAAAAWRAALRLAGVDDQAWARPVRRSDGATFTLGSLARYPAHDPVHHLWDVRGLLAASR